MIDLREKPKSYLILLTLVAILGAVSAIITFGFIELVNKVFELIWDNASLAIGMAGHLTFPNTPIAVIVAATMTGALVATLKAPLFAALFTMVLVQADTAPVIAIAVLVSAMLTAIINDYTSKQKLSTEAG